MINTHPISNMGELVRLMVLGAEGFNLQPANIGDHTITYGYGYTFIQRRTNGTWFIPDFLDDDLAAIGITLTDGPNNPNDEMDQLRSIAAALNGNNLALADNLIAQFTQNWRYVDLTDTEAQTLYEQVIGRKADEIHNLFCYNLRNTVGGRTNGDTLFQALQNTREMAALLSLAYNGTSLIGPNLTKALWNGNRAEAWYEIRYQSNNGPDLTLRPGLAKRHYMESQVFGLYDNPNNVTLTDAQQAYRMLQQHRTDIISYEQQYGVPIDSSVPAQGDRIATANRDFATVLTQAGVGNVLSIEQSLNPAKTALLADLRSRYQSNQELINRLQDNAVVSTNIYLNPHKPTDSYRGSAMDALPYETGTYATTGANDVMIGMDHRDWMNGRKGNDTLLGEGGHDVLLGDEGSDALAGGDGDDKLDGGTGNDFLYGGNGFDTYIVEGNDRIIDSDGKGIVKDKNGKVIAGAFIKQADGSYIWANDTQVTATKNSPLTLYLPDGSSVVIEDFGINGDLGIRLLENPVDPVTTNTITGNEYANNYTDTSANDKIATGGGDDTIVADAGGSDEILGGSGRDAISAGYGDDIAEGGTESDIVFGGGGNDEIFGDTSGNMEDIISAGETATNINEKGDLVSGNDGNDLVYGSNKKDALFGGEGHDLLVGAGGDDVIYGDHDATGAWIDWSYTVANNQANFTNVATGPGAAAGDDTIYAGTGNDLVYAGGADDEVDAGEGNDTVFGEAGDDFITGAGGSDTLMGDGLHIAASEHGSDYIDGGAGSDTIWGGGGSDDLFGGEGNDYIVGDDGVEGAGDDYIDGEAGDDTIHGSAGSDTLFGGIKRRQFLEREVVAC